MRVLILSLTLAATALPVLAQTTPSREALTLGGRVARAAQPRLEQNLQALVQNLADNYRRDATAKSQTVDEKSLAEVIKSEGDAVKPVLWDGMGRIYAETYSTDELKALADFYRSNPGAPAQNLPTSLAAKNDDIQRRERDLVGQIGPRIMQDFFGDYCSRAPCSDDIRRAAGLPVRAKN